MEVPIPEDPLIVFIDANIYLSFYAYPATDLKQLAKIPALIKSPAIRVFITDQVCDEIARNREEKIAQCIETFTKSGSPPLFGEKKSDRG